MRMIPLDRPLTNKVELPGGANRLRELIIYVSEQCADARRFGAVKLNKIIWRADFESYASRRVPVTGREYRRQIFGPVPKEMVPLHRDMVRDRLISLERRVLAPEVIEDRTLALVKPNLDLFTPEDMGFVNASIRHYWSMTGEESSDESHGVAWSTRSNGDPMPYELAFLSDEPLDIPHRKHIAELIYQKGWASE
jgi:hypothetical protein